MGIAQQWPIDCVQETLAFSRFDGGNESERKKARHLVELSEWCEKGRVSGLLQGKDLRNMRRMVRAKKVEVDIEAGNHLRGAVELARVRPLGRQIKVTQRLLNSRRSSRRLVN